MAVYKDPVKKTWFCKFRYTDWQGKSHVTTKRGFRTQKEAKAYEAERLNKITNENAFSEVLDGFLKDQKASTKPSTYLVTRRAVESYIRPQMGNIRIKDITPKVVREWQLSLQEYISPMTGRKLKPSTIKAICGQLSAVLSYAVKYYGLASNPLDVVGTIGRATRSQRFWSLEEYRQFSAILPDELRLYFDVLFYSGMRLGEFLALSPSDIDFEAGTISISKSMMMSTKTITTPKTRQSVRTIAMPKEIIKRIKEHIEKYYEPPERICDVTHYNMERYIKKYAEQAGVPVIHVHDLRHSHASLLVHNNVPITAISHRLGHSSPAITLRVYSHMYKESQEDIAALLSTFVVKM